jgi:hypothetical protein
LGRDTSSKKDSTGMLLGRMDFSGTTGVNERVWGGTTTQGGEWSVLVIFRGAIDRSLRLPFDYREAPGTGAGQGRIRGGTNLPTLQGQYRGHNPHEAPTVYTVKARLFQAPSCKLEQLPVN